MAGSRRVTPHRCPECGRLNDHAGDGNGSLPAAGDISLCWGCGYAAAFNADGSTRRPTANEAREIEQLASLRAARYAIAESYSPSEAIAMLGGSDG